MGGQMNLTWLSPEMSAALESMTEVQRVATVLAGEARSEPVEGIVGVANVIGNRVKARSWFGSDFSDVVTKKQQFSCLFEGGGKSNYKRVLAIAQKFADRQEITDRKVRQCVLIAHGIVGDYLEDNTKGSNHYHTVNLLPRPKWAEGVTPTKQIGGHVFYAGIK
jgi:spore germination cell wall hydrolase CwlJ-like protein